MPFFDVFIYPGKPRTIVKADAKLKGYNYIILSAPSI